jgi:hypothetical protein
MPRFLTIFLAVLALGSFAGMAWMLASRGPDDTQVAELRSEVQKLKQENARLREQAAQRPAPAAAPVTAPVVATAPNAGADRAAADLAAGAAGAPKTPAAGLREMMATPGMRAMMEQQQAMQIDMGYGKLMNVLGLNDEEKAHFKKLLLEREKTQTDMALKLLDPNLTPQERQKLTQDMQAVRKTYDSTLKAFLNDTGDYNTFKHWEDTQPERVQFDMMGRSRFASSNEPLSEQQEQQLIDLMADVRKSPVAPRDFADPATTDPTQMTPERINRYIKELETMHGTVEAKAANILSPGQVKILQGYLEQTRNMAATGMNMSRMMLNGGK